MAHDFMIQGNCHFVGNCTKWYWKWEQSKEIDVEMGQKVNGVTC